MSKINSITVLPENFEAEEMAVALETDLVLGSVPTQTKLSEDWSIIQNGQTT